MDSPKVFKEQNGCFDGGHFVSCRPLWTETHNVRWNVAGVSSRRRCATGIGIIGRGRGVISAKANLRLGAGNVRPRP